MKDIDLEIVFYDHGELGGRGRFPAGAVHG